MSYFHQIFEDVNGSYSSKRTAFFVFIILFVGLTIAVVLKAVPPEKLSFVQSTQDKLTDLIKWLGGFIVGEQAVAFAPKKDRADG